MASMMMMNSATTVSRVATRSGAKRVATRSGANPSSAVRRVAAPVVSVGGFGCTAAARRSGGVSLSSSRNAVVVRAAEEGGEGSESQGKVPSVLLRRSYVIVTAPPLFCPFSRTSDMSVTKVVFHSSIEP